MRNQITKIITLQFVLLILLTGAAFAQNRGRLFSEINKDQILRRGIESGAIDTENLTPDSSGALDPTFGTGGRVVTNLPTDDEILNMAIQADGKMIVSGFDYNFESFYLIRYNTDGTLDNSFGRNGVSRFPASQGRFGYWGLIVLPDGKILMSGVNFLPGNQGDMAVFKFKANGAFDETWGTNGMATVSIGGYDEGYQILVQPDGKILLIGEGERAASGIFDLAAARLNADGTLDTSFGTGGKAVYPRPELINLVISRSAVLQSDGKIVILGANATNIDVWGKLFLLRINPDGTTDNSFGANGFIFPPTAQVNGQIRQVRLQSDGKIVFAMRSFDSSFGNSTSSVYRYNTNGTPDANFGTNGIAPFNGSRAGGLVLQTDGKMIVGGFAAFPDGSQSFRLQRLNPNGSNDPTFGANGIITTGFERNSLIRDIEFQADGKLLAVGALFTGAEPFDIAAARYNVSIPSAPPRFDFDGDGRDDLSVYRPTEGIWYLLGSSNNVFSGAHWGIASDKLAPADYDGDRKSDLAVYRNGVWYVLQSSNNTAQIYSVGDAGGAAVPGDYDGDGLADVAVFSGGVWRVRQSSNNTLRTVNFGLTTDKPIVGDFDADGKQDFCVYRDGTWWILQSSNNQTKVANFGTATDKPVAADYDGDAKTDLAIYRNGAWWILQSSNDQVRVIIFGIASDKPVPADYDGDGRADIAIYRDGAWWIQRSSTAAVSVSMFGLANDTPIETAYLP